MAGFTVEQYKEAARKALAGGDTAAAKRLIDAGRALQAQTETAAQPKPPNAGPEGMARPDASYPAGQVPVASVEEAKANRLLTDRAAAATAPAPVDTTQYDPMTGVPVGGSEISNAPAGPTFQDQIVQGSKALPADAKNANILWALQQGADQGQVRPPDAVAGSPETLPRPTGSGPWVLNPQTNQYINREDMKANIDPDAADAIKLGAFNSLTFGAADNIAGAVDPYTGELMKALREKTQEDNPGAALSGDIVGAVASPITAATKAKTLWSAVKSGASTGSIWGALYGFNNADNANQSRIKEGVVNGLLGGAIGGAAPIVLNGVWRALRPAFDRASVKTTVENLKNVKDTAYKIVESKGIAFNKANVDKAIADFGQRLQVEGLNLANIVKSYPQIARQVNALRTMVAKGAKLPLERLDKLRSAAQDIRFNANTPAEVTQDLSKFVGAIDDMIDGAMAGSDDLKVAREAYRTWMQAAKIDDAFRDAQLNAAASGSGGNIANTMKQALNKILKNDKESAWFRQETLDLMESVVLGSTGRDVLRRIGKLSPNGNGLMLSLGILQAQLNPMMAGVSALGAVAKGLADGTVKRGGRDILEEISGAALRRPVATMNAAPLIPPATEAVNALRGYGQ
jgi:hypothetical protein